METNKTQREAGSLRLGVSGLGGWLILVQIGLYVTILMMLLQLINQALPLLQSEDWELLTTEGSEYYDPLWEPLIVFEVTASVLVLFFAVYCLYIMYRRKASFPKFMIVFLLANLVMGLIDYGIVSQIDIVKELDMMDDEDTRAVSRSAFMCAIWIPYFLRSVRVKNTFIH